MNVRTFIAVVVTVVWAANYSLVLFVRGYSPPLELNVVMVGVVGYFFGSGIRKGIRGEDDSGDKTV